MDSDWLRHFWLLLKNHCMYWHQTCYKCSSSGLEKWSDFLLLSEIQEGCHGLWFAVIIFNFSGTTVWTITKFATNVPLVVLKKCCHFSPRTLIGWNIFYFSRTTALPVTKFLNGPVEMLFTFCFIQKFKMAAMDSDLAGTFMTSQKLLPGLSPNLPQLFVSIFNLHFSYIKMKDLASSGKKVDFCFQVAHIVPTSLQWGSCCFKQWHHIYWWLQKGWNSLIIVTS